MKLDAGASEGREDSSMRRPCQAQEEVEKRKGCGARGPDRRRRSTQERDRSLS